MLSSQKGLTMPTTSLSINGVPYTDTANFLAEFARVNEQHLDNLFTRLSEWAELEEAGTDEFESYLSWEAVRVPKWGSSHVAERRVSKEVK
jgi:hypothetical protein